MEPSGAWPKFATTAGILSSVYFEENFSCRDFGEVICKKAKVEGRRASNNFIFKMS